MLGPEELELLGFAGAQRLISPIHAQGLQRCSAAEAGARLDALVARKLLAEHRVFAASPPAYTITRRGLALLGSSLAAPQLNVSTYAHDLGVAWLAVVAERSGFGRVERIVGEREMRSRDTALRGLESGLDGDGAERLAVRLFGEGPRGGGRLHYPDMLLITPAGRRIAVELELTPKSRRRLERIVEGYACAQVDAVLYLVERDSVGRAVEAAARRAGVADKVHVQSFSWAGRGPVPTGADASRAGSRSAGRDRAR